MTSGPAAGRGSQAGSRDRASTALRAFGAAILGAGIWIGLAGPFGLTWGLLAVAVFVGWLIGSSASRSDRSRGPRPDLRAIAVGGALLAWALGLVGVYLYSLATLPSLGPAGSTLAERIGSTSIVAFYAAQLGPLDLAEAAILVATAWWAAR